MKSILDLGCGTGSHAYYLTDMGFEVTGIDMSSEMLKIAREKRIENAEFVQGDIRNFDLNKKFDAVIAMFSVMSYQTSNQDFEDTIRSVKRHLNPGGLFIFDVWFGPAVLIQKPGDRVKKVEKNGYKIIRTAHPILDIKNHTVNVNYEVKKIKGSKIIEQTEELHKMRFFFYQELVYYLENNGFEVLKICPFMEYNKEVSSKDWNICVISALL